MKKILGGTLVLFALWGLTACQEPTTPAPVVTPQVASPVFSPLAGAVASGSTVTLTTSTTGATIYYTVDGTAPTKASSFGTAAGSTATITITTAQTIKAFAAKTGFADSAVVSSAYTIDTSYASAPGFYTDSALTAAVAGVTAQYTGTVTLYLKNADTNVTLYYTVDGTEPTVASLAYAAGTGIVIPAATTAKTTTVVKAKAIANAGSGWHDSPVATLTVTDMPVLALVTAICPDNGSIVAQQSKTWFDVKIVNKAALGAGWKVLTSYSTGTTSVVLKDTDAAFTNLSGFADGDTLRIHQAGYTPVDTASKTGDADGNTTVWDVAAANYPYYAYGLIWIEQADGTIVDLVAYTGQKNTASSWVTGASLTALQNAVTAGQWSGAALADALVFTDSTKASAQLTASALSNALGGQKASDWTQVLAPYAVVSAVTVTPSPLTVSTATSVTVSATVTTGNGVTTPDSVVVDLTSLGGSASQALTTLGTASPYTYTANVSVTPATTGSFTPTVTAASAVTGVKLISASGSVAVKNASYLTFGAVTTDVANIPADTATTVTATVNITATNCAVTGVTADLSAVGGSSSTALTVSGSTATGTFTVNKPVGLYSIPLTATGDQGVASQSYMATLYVASAPAFAKSDMENGGPTGLPTNGSISTTEHFDGSASFHYSASLSATATVPLTSTLLSSNGSFTKLVFWFKGTTSGTAPGLRFQVASGGTVVNYYDLNAIVSGTTLSVSPTTGGSYSTTAINVGTWTKVVLDLTGVNWASTGKTAITDYALTFRVRSPSVHDWYIDGIHFE